MNRGEHGGPGEQPVHSITGAVTPHSDDLDARIRRYLISMSLRVLCVVMAIVVHTRWGHWSWWIFAVGAVLLPYVAVVMANAVDKGRGGPGAPPVTPQTRFVLPSQSSNPPQPLRPEPGPNPSPQPSNSSQPSQRSQRSQPEQPSRPAQAWTADEEITVTIHPPKSPVDPTLPDEGPSGPTFGTERPRRRPVRPVLPEASDRESHEWPC